MKPKIISLSVWSAGSYVDSAERLVKQYKTIKKQIEKINKEDLIKLKHISNRMETIQLEIRPILAKTTSICAKCREYCCDSNIHHYRIPDVIYTCLRNASLPEPKVSIRRIGTGQTARTKMVCIFLGEKGCRVDAFLRPYVCLGYICGNFIRAMTKKDTERFNELKKEYSDLCDKLNTLLSVFTGKRVFITKKTKYS